MKLLHKGEIKISICYGKKKKAQIIGFNYFKNFRITRTEKKFFFKLFHPLIS